MLHIGNEYLPLCSGVNRRSFLQVGAAAMAGLSLPSWLSLQAAGAVDEKKAKIRNCITIFLVGSPGHLDTWDMKPDAPEDIRGKVLNQPIYELLGGKVRDDILLYTHPDGRNFTTDEGVVREIRAIVDSGHTALKFDPFPHLNRIGAADDIYLDGSMSKQGENRSLDLRLRVRGGHVPRCYLGR